ncbi:TPA: hypothetical protein QEM76_000241 [Pseudomonas putida]|jgi:hypothetical protein|nr:hypothetical protein [Pseudomonas putida]HDS1803586.1 hypothetical protein [Pseudomonas putida]
MRYNTSNPVEPNGSDDPRDAYDNFANMDLAVNGGNPSWTDRTGKVRKSWEGIEAQVTNYLIASSYESTYVVYATGAVVQRQTQLVQRSGELYRVTNSADLPLTLTGTWTTDSTRLQAVGDQALRQQLGVGFAQKLDGSWYQPNDLDLTGSVDETTKVLGYLTAYKRVRLPAGAVKLDLVVPSGCSLVGAGRTDMNRTNKVWASGGTTVIGSIGVTGSKGCVIGAMNIDCFASGGNALAGNNSSTTDHYIFQVNTRADNHGQLWEQNAVGAERGQGGNIFVTDCKHYDGPNGFVSKMKDVTFLRCFAYDVSVQAHVAVSDNINGAGIYSRAENTKFIDCGGDGCNIGLSIYSRDAFSSTNANGVAGTIGTYWSGTHTNVTAGFIHVGLFRPIDAGTTALFNDQVTIGGGQFFNAPVFGVRFDDAARPRVLAGHFQNCANPIVYGVNCVDPYVDDAVSCYGAINPGILSPYIVETSGGSAINVDIVRSLLIFQNTAVTTVTQLVTSARTRHLRVLIDDTVTTLSIGGVALTGKGSVVELLWSDVTGAWTVMSGGSQLPDSELPFPYSLTLGLTWRSKAALIEMTGNINVLDISGANVPKGTAVVLRLRSASNYSVFNWQGVTWGTITPVSAIAANVTVVLQMYWTGTTFIVMAVNHY